MQGIKISKQDAQMIVHLREQRKFTLLEIAITMDCSTSTVKRVLKEHRESSEKA